MSGAVEAAQCRAGLDQQRDGKTEQHRARHDDGHIEQRIAQRLPEGGSANSDAEIRKSR